MSPIYYTTQVHSNYTHRKFYNGYSTFVRPRLVEISKSPTKTHYYYCYLILYRNIFFNNIYNKTIVELNENLRFFFQNRVDGILLLSLHVFKFFPKWPIIIFFLTKSEIKFNLFTSFNNIYISSFYYYSRQLLILCGKKFFVEVNYS